jgi:hypothetical protein
MYVRNDGFLILLTKAAKGGRKAGGRHFTKLTKLNKRLAKLTKPCQSLTLPYDTRRWLGYKLRL